jgi:nitroreductase
MDLHLAVATRRTVQRFRPDPVPADALHRALDAAQQAPNHKLTWPWRFLLPGPVTRERLFQVGLRLRAQKKGGALTPAIEASVRQDMLVPARLVVVVQRVADDANRALEDHAACAAAVQNLMLSLHADGYASKWGTGGALRDAEALQALGVDAATERVVAFVWVGVAEVVPQAPARPADRVVHLP